MQKAAELLSCSMSGQHAKKETEPSIKNSSNSQRIRRFPRTKPIFNKPWRSKITAAGNKKPEPFQVTPLVVGALNWEVSILLIKLIYIKPTAYAAVILRHNPPPLPCEQS